MTPSNLEGWRKTIEDETPFVGLKPFSHNIIAIALAAIDKKYGRAEAARAIKDFNLVELGWKELDV